MTLREIASTIENNVSDALSGANVNRALPRTQIEGEIDLLREKLAFDLIRAGKIDLKYFLQNIDSLPLICRDLTKDCGSLKFGEQIPSVKLKKLLALGDNSQIEFVGLANKQKRFTIYYDVDDISNHKFRLKTAHVPFVWVDLTPDGNDDITLYFFNLDKYDGLKYVDVRAAFAQPVNVKPLDPMFDEKEYPAPGYIQQLIIDTLTNKYLEYYRKGNIPNLPNTQTDPIV